MARPSKGARLWLRTQRYKTKDGVVHVNRVWVIKDGRRWESTGCSAEQVAEAERKLQEYLAAKHAPRGSPGLHQTTISVSDLLYLIDKLINESPSYRTGQGPTRAGDDDSSEGSGKLGD